MTENKYNVPKLPIHSAVLNIYYNIIIQWSPLIAYWTHFRIKSFEFINRMIQ